MVIGLRETPTLQTNPLNFPRISIQNEENTNEDTVVICNYKKRNRYEKKLTCAYSGNNEHIPSYHMFSEQNKQKNHLRFTISRNGEISSRIVPPYELDRPNPIRLLEPDGSRLDRLSTKFQ